MEQDAPLIRLKRTAADVHVGMNFQKIPGVKIQSFRIIRKENFRKKDRTFKTDDQNKIELVSVD